MTLNEATTLVAGQLNKDLNVPFKLMLAERIHYWRARLIKNSVDKDQKDRKFFRQVIFIPMEVSSENPCCDVLPGCPVATTKVPVPQPLRANSILFDYVGSVNGMNPFQEAVGGFIAYMSAGKYSKNVIRYTWNSPKINVFGNADLPMLRVEGIFDNPEEAALLSCNGSSDEGCDFWNKEYPVTGDIMQLIIQSIVQVDFAKPGVPGEKDVPVSTLNLKDQ